MEASEAHRSSVSRRASMPTEEQRSVAAKNRRATPFYSSFLTIVFPLKRTPTQCTWPVSIQEENYCKVTMDGDGVPR